MLYIFNYIFLVHSLKVIYVLCLVSLETSIFFQWLGVAWRPQRPCGLLGTGSPGRSPRFSLSACLELGARNLYFTGMRTGTPGKHHCLRRCVIALAYFGVNFYTVFCATQCQWTIWRENGAHRIRAKLSKSTESGKEWCSHNSDWWSLIMTDGRLYSAILRSLEQTHCARMWFYMSD